MRRVDGISLAPPLSVSALERMRLDLRNRLPGEGLGVHQHRQKGQLLTFREFRDYAPGDDIRKVDWRVSARQGLGWRKDGIHITMRDYEAELRHTVLLLVDCRLAMTLPRAMPKLIVAGWIAQCLGLMALSEQDRVLVAPVFLPTLSPSLSIRKAADIQSIQTLIEAQFARAEDDDAWMESEAVQTDHLFPRLDATTSVVLISDMLFADEAHRLADFARHAQRSYRSFHVVELDSWEHERSLLEKGPFQLAASHARDFDDGHFEATVEFLDRTVSRLDDHRSVLRRTFAGPGLVWLREPFEIPVRPSESSDNAVDWFRIAFSSSNFLPALVSKAAT